MKRFIKLLLVGLLFLVFSRVELASQVTSDDFKNNGIFLQKGCDEKDTKCEALLDVLASRICPQGSCNLFKPHELVSFPNEYRMKIFNHSNVELARSGKSRYYKHNMVYYVKDYRESTAAYLIIYFKGKPFVKLLNPSFEKETSAPLVKPIN